VPIFLVFAVILNAVKDPEEFHSPQQLVFFQTILSPSLPLLFQVHGDCSLPIG
jgi:hypothetical protein